MLLPIAWISLVVESVWQDGRCEIVSRIVIIAAVFTTAIGSVAGAVAAESEAASLKMVGLSSTQNINKYILEPYFSDEITENSGGSVVVDYKTADSLSLKGTEVLRLLKLGVFDLAAGAISYFAGDDPRFEGLDLPGLALDIESTRQVAQAYFPVIEKIMADNHGTKLFALAPITMQTWYCRGEITGLEDLKGKKIRVFNRSMADFVEAIGAGSVNIPFPEVVPAMNRGVADCAITGTSAGNTARWWEVTRYLYTMPMGWAIQFYGMNINSWQRLEPRVQRILVEEFNKLDQRMWAQAASDVQDGINCNTGAGVCKDGIEATRRMTWVKVSDADRKLHKKIVEKTVVYHWAQRCGTECARQWNATVGNVVRMKAPVE